MIRCTVIVEPVLALPIVTLLAEICLDWSFLSLVTSRIHKVFIVVAFGINPEPGVFPPKSFLNPFSAAIIEYLRLDTL